MIGFLVIFVTGYRNESHTAWHLNNPEMSWNGWAVGEHRYCSRHAFDKMRRFTAFDDAVCHIYLRQKKRPSESYQLVYVREKERGAFDIHFVSNLDEIEAVDNLTLLEDSLKTQRVFEFKTNNFPYLEQLSAQVSQSMAMNLSSFINDLKTKDRKEVKAQIGSSYFRKVKQLRALNLGQELNDLLDA